MFRKKLLAHREVLDLGLLEAPTLEKASQVASSS